MIFSHSKPENYHMDNGDHIMYPQSAVYLPQRIICEQSYQLTCRRICQCQVKVIIYIYLYCNYDHSYGLDDGGDDDDDNGEEEEKQKEDA